MLSRQFTHEGTLANGWKAYKSYTSNARPRNIETGCQELELGFLFRQLVLLTASATSAGLWCKKFPLQFSKLGLQLAQMVARRLVLLGLGHLGLDVLDL